MTEIVNTSTLVHPVTGRVTHYATTDDGRVWATAETDDGVTVWYLVAPPLPAAAWRPHRTEDGR